MKPFLKRLENIAKKLGNLEHRLEAVQGEYKARRRGAYKAHNEAVRKQKAADKAGLSTVRGKHLTDEAHKLHSKAYKEHGRAQWKLGKIKEYQQRIKKLKENESIVRANLEKYKKEHGVYIEGNSVKGGNARERLKVALEEAELNCRNGDQHNYYSMSGGWDIKHCIENMPYGLRFDCSSFATGIHWSCGLSDPNGLHYAGGYTETLAAHCEKISRSEVKVGDFVIYGHYPGGTHHVEVVLDPAREITIGHGSAPIDRGVFNLFGDGDYAFYRNPALA
jgi:hypothetical protein